jgi:hypothetical protein
MVSALCPEPLVDDIHVQSCVGSTKTRRRIMPSHLLPYELDGVETPIQTVVGSTKRCRRCPPSQLPLSATNVVETPIQTGVGSTKRCRRGPQSQLPLTATVAKTSRSRRPFTEVSSLQISIVISDICVLFFLLVEIVTLKFVVNTSTMEWFHTVKIVPQLTCQEEYSVKLREIQ